MTFAMVFPYYCKYCIDIWCYFTVNCKNDMVQLLAALRGSRESEVSFWKAWKAWKAGNRTITTRYQVVYIIPQIAPISIDDKLSHTVNTGKPGKPVGLLLLAVGTSFL